MPDPSRRAHYRSSLEVICGCMYSGKSEELIRRLGRSRIAKLPVQIFKPTLDDRYDDKRISSHSGGRLEAVPVSSIAELRAALRLDAVVIGIDEVQFFDPAIVSLCLELLADDRDVVAAGLDLDFRGEPFPVMAELLARATHVTKLQAICVQCGAPATRSQRLINGRPAYWEDPIILIGAAETYEARCHLCHIVWRRQPGVEGWEKPGEPTLPLLREGWSQAQGS